MGWPLQQAPGLDAMDGGVGAERHASPQELVGGDADLGRAGQGGRTLTNARTPAQVLL
jgi:hypothetical protein